MFIEVNREEKIKKNKKKIEDLHMQIEDLELEVQELMSELEVSPGQIRAFNENPKNFTEKDWDELQKQKQLIERKLNSDLSSIKNPNQTKEAYENLPVNPNWLFVK